MQKPLVLVHCFIPAEATGVRHRFLAHLPPQALISRQAFYGVSHILDRSREKTGFFSGHYFGVGPYFQTDHWFTEKLGFDNGQIEPLPEAVT